MQSFYIFGTYGYCIVWFLLGGDAPGGTDAVPQRGDPLLQVGFKGRVAEAGVPGGPPQVFVQPMVTHGGAPFLLYSNCIITAERGDCQEVWPFSKNLQKGG